MHAAVSSTVRLLPEAPFIGPWRLTAVAVLLVAAAVLYVIGITRLAALGRRWPQRRAVAFLAGLALVVVATQSGLAAYEKVSFSAHVLQHLLLGMAAPALLALGAPMTLALQVAPGRIRKRLMVGLHSVPVHVLSHPVLVWALFVGSLFVLYMSPLYELSLRHELVHQLVHAHFVLTGALFFWLVMARDPGRRRLTAPARLALTVTTIPFHALLGMVILSSSRPLGALAGSEGLADRRLGAAILWAGGDLVVVLAGLAVFSQWIGQDERTAAQEDRAQAAAGERPLRSGSG